jgi:Na+/proline symporter
MALFAFLVVSLGICLVPVYAVRRRGYARAQDYFVSGEHAPPGVVQNSSVAYALQMAIFGPLFAWGASGDFWPAIISSCSFGLGVCLLYLLRRPMLEFLGRALRRDRSVTVHQFIAHQHGNDLRVRLLASALTVFALAGLIVGEAFAAATLLAPIVASGAATFAIMGGLLALTALYAMPSGNSGVMRSAQAQLGIVYFGLFGSTLLLLYLLMSGVSAMPPHGTLAIALVAVCCALMLFYRRSKYVDTSSIMKVDDGSNASGREPLGSRLFRRFAKILNFCISVMVATVMVFALMELYAEGVPAVLRDSAAALQTGTRVPTMGLVALLLLPLFYPLVDITNWQRMAAFEQNADGKLASTWQPAALRRIFGIYAFETALVWLFMCMFGAIAALSMATPGVSNFMQDFVQQLVAQENFIAGGALSLLLVAVLAIALSTMSAAFSASVCAIRYDILPAFSAEPRSGKTPPVEEARARGRAVTASGTLCLVIFGAFYAVGAYRPMGFNGSGFLALLFAFYCAQLSFVPLVLGPMIGRTRAGAVNPGWALGVIGCGAVVGVGSVAIYLTSGSESWLWAAVPASLGSGFLVFIVARLATTPAGPHSAT